MTSNTIKNKCCVPKNDTIRIKNKMEAYMSQTENKLNIDQLLGNISKNDLIGANGISSNGLATLVENIIHEIMNKEKSEFLNRHYK